MDSLISRQAAIDALCSECQGRCIPCKYYPCSEVKAINALPSVQPEPPWIPVSERPPKLDEPVLVTTEWDDLSIAWRIGIDEWFIHEGNTNSTTDDITAWKPLPKPYRAERRTDE
jgi:hypothetical protein